MAESITREMVAEPVKKLNGDGPDLYNTVVYWHGEACVELSPYRAIVRWIITELQKQYSIEILKEDPEVEGEDFVYHDIAINGLKICIYWENSLGYISFISVDPDLIEEASKYFAGKTPQIA